MYRKDLWYLEMLEENVNTCIGCMISLVNAMNDFEDWPKEFKAKCQELSEPLGL